MPALTSATPCAQPRFLHLEASKDVPTTDLSAAARPPRSTYEDYTPVLDDFYLALATVVLIPLQDVFFAAAVGFKEPAV